MAFLSGSAVRTLVEDLGFEPDDAMRGYLATAGADFRTQLEELAPGRASLGRVADRFEAEQGRWMQRCEPFPDVLPAVDDLVAEGIQVLVCSSTRSSLVRAFCERSGLLGRLTSVDGWAPGRSKSAQLRAGVAAVGMAAGDVIFVGDSRRDADVARAAGTRFVGLVREGHPDVFEGTGCAVVDSITVVADALVRVSRSPVEPSIAG
jgi:phosphoglycolate phosphatase-like HAD superfamily hydrolase